MSDERPSLDEIILAWADGYGNRIPVPAGELRDAFLELLKTCEKYGYTDRSEFGASFQNKILRTCVPEEHRDKKKKKTWEEITKKVLLGTILSYFKVVVIEKITDEEKTRVSEKSYVSRSETATEDVQYETASDIVLRNPIDRSRLPSLKSPPIEEEEFLKEIGLK